MLKESGGGEDSNEDISDAGSVYSAPAKAYNCTLSMAETLDKDSVGYAQENVRLVAACI